MRFLRVLIHGAFTARVRLAPDVEARGFYTTRWVLAGDEEKAVRKASRSVLRELQQWAIVRDGFISVSLDIEEIAPGWPWKWVRGGGGGFTFYGDE